MADIELHEIGCKLQRLLAGVLYITWHLSLHTDTKPPNTFKSQQQGEVKNRSTIAGGGMGILQCFLRVNGAVRIWTVP